MQEAELHVLLEKYINNSCTPEELAELLPYLDRPEVRQELEALMREQWDDFEPLAPEVGLAAHWYERIAASDKKKSGKFIITFHRDWLKYAAILVVAAGLSLILVKRSGNRPNITQLAMIETINPKGQRVSITLPDSSIVTLGPDSRLKYPERFNGTKREISLQGEAFFEVKHMNHKPFIVHTGDVQTQVLGTSFKIEAFNGQKLQVAVATGKVSVGYEKSNSQVTALAVLTPGQMVSWNPKTKTAETGSELVEDILDLKNGKLAFTDARLDFIASRLERWYNTKIFLQGAAIPHYTLGLTIDGKEPITNALDAITAATNLSYSIAGNQIKLYHKPQKKGE